MRYQKFTGFLLLCFITVVVFAGISPTYTFASQSGQLRLNGKWTIQQINSNGATYRGSWIVFQKGSVISGTAEWQNHANGSIKGVIAGNRLDVTILYADGLKGFYKASVADGCLQLVSGTSTSNRGSDTATWVADRLTTVTGQWLIKQQNYNGASYQGDWVISQQGSDISGTAKWANHTGGRIKGKIEGNNLDLTIFYPEGLEGFYKGKRDSACTQIISGTSTANRGSDKATWTAEGKED
jgi:hypothetical protein